VTYIVFKYILHVLTSNSYHTSPAITDYPINVTGCS